ncbi:MAG: sulfite exporter TauE/SafE family protein [Telmatospirillum sp.]|nr:sulfite exporter TauE/SafE family protein [Telmatospirillum sp.]
MLASLFLAGLVGGTSHCTGMCGPFVLSQVAARLERTPIAQMREWHRLTGAALLPYHLGRATTYAGLGGLAALLAGTLPLKGAGLRWISATLLLMAALFMLSLALPALKRLFRGTEGTPGWWSRGIERLARPLFGQPTGWRGYVLGLLLGFIPCGLLYGALAAAAASGDPLTGLLGMLAFTAGTWPSLFAVGLLGHLAGQRWRGPILRYAPLLLVANAGMLTWLAWRHVA